ncbi:MAG: sigma-70 family RNA polymerase sigma factor [Planctomycetota bacterium]
MFRTRATLLMRIKDPRDTVAWREFHALYAPLLYRYARARGLTVADAEEVRDRCLATLARRMTTFEYDRHKGRFQAWLGQLVHNQVTDLLRRRCVPVAGSRIARTVPDPRPTPDELWERQWRRQHLKHCVEHVKVSVSERNYRAFCMLLFEECSVQEVCHRLGMSSGQVYVAKSRVLQRVRERLGELGFEYDG